MKVVLDANFLVLPFQFNIEIFDELERLTGGKYDIYTLDRALNEAVNIEDGKYRSLVKKLMDVKDIGVINTPAEQPVDDDLLDLARRGFVICTNDRELRNRLDDENLPQIFLRQRNHLESKNLRRL